MVSEMSVKASVKKAVDHSGVLKDDPIYKQKTTNGKTILAYLNRANQFYTANCAFKGDIKLHDVLYIAPQELVSEEERKIWAERLDKASVATVKDDPSLITITSGGVFQNHQKLNGHPHKRNFTHPELGFSLSFPSTWAYETTAKTIKKLGSAQGTQYLSFHRMDELTKGSVDIIRADQNITETSFMQLIETAKNTLFQENGLIAQGNIENNEGVKGKYFILKMPDDRFEIVAFYPPQWEPDVHDGDVRA